MLHLPRVAGDYPHCQRVAELGRDLAKRRHEPQRTGLPGGYHPAGPIGYHLQALVAAGQYC